MRYTFDKGHGCLLPADEETEDWLHKQPADALIRGEFKAARNPAHHCKFFALVKLVYENLPEDLAAILPNQDVFLSALKINAGHSILVPTSRMPRGGWEFNHVPKSISFAKMTQGEFEQFYDRCCDVIIRDFWPDMDKVTLKAEVAEMCGAGGFGEIDRMPTGRSEP